MTTPRLASLGAAAIAAGVALSSGCGPRTRSFAFNYNEQHVQLRNGLRVVIVPDTSTALVEVAARYDVGSREDPPGKAGLAHLVEHLMFELQPSGPGSPPLIEFVRHASSFFNAYTTWDSTHYTSEARAEMLEWLLKIEAIRLSHGCEALSEHEFLREREVVRNEIRQRRAEELFDLLPGVLEAVYPAGHAYARPVAGSDAEISSITRDDVCAFIRRHYVPQRAALVVAGRVDVKAVEATVIRLFGGIARRTSAPRSAVAPVAPRGRSLTRDAPIARSVLVVAWPLPPSTTPEGAAAALMMSRLASGTRELVLWKGAATEFSAGTIGGQHAPVYIMLMELADRDGSERALDLVRRSVRDARTLYYARIRELDNRAEREDMDELRVRLKSDFVQRVEPLDARADVIGDMVQFESNLPFLSDQAFLAHALTRIDALSGQQITDAVDEIVQNDRATVILFRATGEPGKDDQRALHFETRSHAPREEPAGPPREALTPLTVPQETRVGLARAVRFHLDNGMSVVLFPREGLPIVSVRLLLGAGDAQAAQSPGAAQLAAAMLRPPDRMDPLDGTGIEVDCDSGPDETVCTVDGINIYLGAMLRGLEQTVVPGRYDDASVEKTVDLAGRLDAPERAERALWRQYRIALFGGDHPYARGLLSDAPAGARVTTSALRSFHDRHYTASNATLIVAGNFDPAEAREFVQDAFEDWESGTRSSPVPPTPRRRTGPEHIGVVGRIGPQTKIILAYPAPAGIDRQEAARRVMTGMLDLRIERIRSELGAAYSANARRAPLRGPSAYMARADVDSARAGEALRAMRDAVDSMRRGHSLAADFVRARRKVVADLLAESAVSRELSVRLAAIAAFALPADFYEDLVRRAAAVTLADVEVMVRAELRLDREVVLLGGERAALERAFKEAGIDSPRFVDPGSK